MPEKGFHRGIGKGFWRGRIGNCIKIPLMLHEISALIFVEIPYKTKEISGFSINIIVIECFTNVNWEVIMKITYYIQI